MLWRSPNPKSGGGGTTSQSNSRSLAESSPAQPSSQTACLRARHRGKGPEPKVQSTIQSPEVRLQPSPAQVSREDPHGSARG